MARVGRPAQGGRHLLFVGKAAACALLLTSLSGCRVDQLDATTSTDARAELVVERVSVEPAPKVRLEIELSEFTRDHFVGLDVEVLVVSGQGLAGQGLEARWLGRSEEGGSARFAGALDNELTLTLSHPAEPCATLPCVLTLELAPSGVGTSDVAFPLRYRAFAYLEVEREDRLVREEDLRIRLEVAP